MALEPLYQKHCARLKDGGKSNDVARNDLCYRFRNVHFRRALVFEEGKDVAILVTSTAGPGSKDWHEFRIYTTVGGMVIDHCIGPARIQDPLYEPATGDGALSLTLPQAPKL